MKIKKKNLTHILFLLPEVSNIKILIIAAIFNTEHSLSSFTFHKDFAQILPDHI